MNTNPIAVIVALFVAVVFVLWVAGEVGDVMHRMGML